MLGGKFNLGSLLKGAKKMQEVMEQNQAELARLEVTGESGAGLVKVIMTGDFKVKELFLADELLTESKEVIQDLITAAMNIATQKAGDLARGKMADMGQLFSMMQGDKSAD